VSLPERPLVSCLCVTEDRAAFLPWLLRGYDAQTYPHRELVVVDSSREVWDLGGRPDIRVVSMDHGSWIPDKRNRALEEARGEIVMWFDDDDWQHPERLARLVAVLAKGAPYAGPATGWFIDVRTLRCHRHVSRGCVFNGLAFRREVAASVRFDVGVRKASDTRYLRALARRYGPGRIVNGTLFAWLCHENNISNPRRLRSFREPIQRLVNAVSESAWGDSTAALEALRERLGHPKEAVSTGDPIPQRSRRRVQPRPRVVVLKRFGIGATVAGRRARFGS
jgi:glycosyltransferase involved in cell wall biosynthesis